MIIFIIYKVNRKGKNYPLSKDSKYEKFTKICVKKDRPNCLKVRESFSC